MVRDARSRNRNIGNHGRELFEELRLQIVQQYLAT